MNLDLQTINEVLKSENEELRIEAEKQRLIIDQNLDVRMGYFGMDMPGSSTGSRASSQSSNRTGEAVNRSAEEIAEIDKAIINQERMKQSKSDVKMYYLKRNKIEELKCLFCGATDQISMAHIVSSGAKSYAPFGDDLDPFSCRNFIPLCGTKGSWIAGKRTCHNLYHSYLVAMVYNPLLSTYDVHNFAGPDSRLKELCRQIAMKIPVECKPYQRLITWRGKKTLKEYGNNLYATAETTALLNQSIASLEIKLEMSEGIPTRSCGTPLSSIKNDSVNDETVGSF
jgi:hypothetical protein